MPSSPNPSSVGYTLGRRTVLKGAAGVAGLAAFPGLLAACGDDESTAAGDFSLGSASGDLTVGSNYSDDLPKQALAAAVAALPNSDITPSINTTDHNSFQENISTYLQQPDDVLPWFAGYRMRFFAEQGLLGDISDVWDGGLDDQLGEGFKIASTGDDGLQYFVPFSYYIWGVYYRPSLFEANGYTVPTTLDELKTLSAAMQDDGLTPFAFGNDGRWPAMGTFDQLNFRTNGYQFHVDLMAGKESWEDDRVKEVFNTFGELLPFHQENPNGRTWEAAAASMVDGESGMYTIGTFVGSQFPEGDTSDLDFFTFPEINSEHGVGTVEAPIDGFMMAAEPKNGAAAKELLYHFGTAEGQAAYLEVDPSVVAPSTGVDTSLYSPLQAKVLDAVASAPTVTQFLDRDTSPEFASNVAGPAIADFISDPSKIDSILASVEEQAKVILGS